MSSDVLHPSHVTRFSDSSVRDYICVNCGASDEVPGGWGDLAKPCSKPVGEGGLTFEQWVEKDKERIAKLKEKHPSLG